MLMQGLTLSATHVLVQGPGARLSLGSAEQPLRNAAAIHFLTGRPRQLPTGCEPSGPSDCCTGEWPKLALINNTAEWLSQAAAA